MVWLRVPIWLGLMSTALAAFIPIPSRIRCGSVTNRSSPTSCMRLPRRWVSCTKPLPVIFSERVLQGTDGILSAQAFPVGNQLGGVIVQLGFWQQIFLLASLRLGTPFGGSCIQSQHKVLSGTKVCPFTGFGQQQKASSSPVRLGANPPSSPTPQLSPFRTAVLPKRWWIRLHHSIAWEILCAPTGMTINSWMSRLLEAWAPPFNRFIIGMGRVLDHCAA